MKSFILILSLFTLVNCTSVSQVSKVFKPKQTSAPDELSSNQLNQTSSQPPISKMLLENRVELFQKEQSTINAVAVLSSLDEYIESQNDPRLISCFNSIENASGISLEELTKNTAHITYQDSDSKSRALVQAYTAGATIITADIRSMGLTQKYRFAKSSLKRFEPIKPYLNGEHKSIIRACRSFIS